MEWEGGWDRTDRIMNVGQRGEQLLGLASDFGRVMSASDSSSVLPSLTGFHAPTVPITKQSCCLLSPLAPHQYSHSLKIGLHKLPSVCSTQMFPFKYYFLIIYFSQKLVLVENNHRYFI
jgi:hypothetical protein